MAEVIQFNCPACGTMLRLPLEMASRQGPCPTCDREIVAPDPHRGIGAYEVAIAPPPKEIEPFRIFADSPPLVPKEPEPAAAEMEESEPVEVESPPMAAETDGPPPAVVPPPGGPRRLWPILVPSCLASAVIGGVVVHSFIARAPRPPIFIPPASLPVLPAPAVEKEVVVAELKKPEPAPEPVVEETESEVAPIEEKASQEKASAPAEATLRAFLDAPDWAARSAYVLSPDKVCGAMEAYSREVPDGPILYQSISVKQSHLDEKTGATLFIFFVATEKHPKGIPVAVKETPGGWLVDWPAFVEFRDGLFQKFVEGPIDQTGDFHLVVSRPPAERAASTENEHFSSFLLQSPLDAKPQIAFVRKSSQVAAEFEAQLATAGSFQPVLEVVKRKTSGGRGYFEVLSVKEVDWFPKEK
ncbi:MAG: hypothetical protein V4584_11815 [Verrucomicrobiota bacterium]